MITLTVKFGTEKGKNGNTLIHICNLNLVKRYTRIYCKF